MAHNLIIGGGLAGCTVARELAEDGQEVTIIEKADNIGGKVRYYGCKATEQCNNCGLCIIGDLWESVQSNGKVRILTNTQLIDVLGSKGNFEAFVKTPKGIESLTGITNIIVSTGFQQSSTAFSGNLEIEIPENIIYGSQMERLISKRNRKGIFEEKPKSVAFIQCYGSRDAQQNHSYCSRVCCAYSTRMAKVLKHFYPDINLVFFYMDLQKVEEGDYFDCLVNQQNFEFIRCRPVKVKGGTPCSVLYESPGNEGIKQKDFDIVILSEGIYPSEDNEKTAELCMLGFNKYGFLRCVKDGNVSGIYLAGCASGPKRVEEVYAESLEVARQIKSS